MKVTYHQISLPESYYYDLHTTFTAKGLLDPPTRYGLNYTTPRKGGESTDGSLLKFGSEMIIYERFPGFSNHFKQPQV